MNIQTSVCKLPFDDSIGIYDLGPPKQEGHGPVASSPEKGHEDAPQAGAPLLQRQADKLHRTEVNVAVPKWLLSP